MYLTYARKIVKEAGELIQENFYQEKSFKFKEDLSIVTELDKKIELFVKDNLLKKFPETSFLGEETGSEDIQKDLVWICDPIDGTRSFTNNENTLSISLALMKKEKVILGIIYNPITEEFYFTDNDVKPMKNTVSLPFIHRKKLKNSIVNFQVTSKKSEFIKELYDLWEEKKIGKLVSTCGSLAYNLAKIAEGIHSSYIVNAKKGANIWDIAGGYALIKNAGGIITDFKGKEIDIFKKNHKIIASTNKEIHKEVLELIKHL